MKLPDFHQMTRREIEDYLIEKSLADLDFRRRLIENPATTLATLGLPVGNDVKIRVLVEEPGSFCIVLPRVLREANDEVDLAELENISGGNVANDTELFFRGYL